MTTTPAPQGYCQFPGCTNRCAPTAAWCSEHARKRRNVATVQSKQRKKSYTGVRISPCDNCPVLSVCRSEIGRPSYWPPCFKCSRHYDKALAAKVYKGQAVTT